MYYSLLTAVLAALLITGCASSDSGENTADYEQFKAFEAPGQKLTVQELTLATQAAGQHFKSLELTPAEKLQFQPYLAQAQWEYAQISQFVNGTPQGSFAPVTISMLRLFDAEANIPSLQARPYDQQTLAISDYVADKFEDRLLNEKSHIRSYNVQIGPQKWYSRKGYFGISFGSVEPWYLDKCDQYRCPSPDADLLAEAKDIKIFMSENNPKKIEAIHYWVEADWVAIADAYMEKNQTDLNKRLEVRAVLTSALADAMAAAFDSKYTYWVKRPHQVDGSIRPLIETPNHPSYPSGHSTIGKTAAVVLTHYFPENKSNWDAMAQEAGLSRIWAGVHYPMDHAAGVVLGEKVGNNTIKSIEGKK